ncbi:MAG: PGPGW domain-containing protein [bacterium]|nr:PGPGW domain-containing protein [bacterium]
MGGTPTQPTKHDEPGPHGAAFAAALKLVRTILGFSVLLVGILMIALPGPAVVVIPLGLAILATEYAWARRYLNKFKDGGQKLGAIRLRKKTQGR